MAMNSDGKSPKTTRPFLGYINTLLVGVATLYTLASQAQISRQSSPTIEDVRKAAINQQTVLLRLEAPDKTRQLIFGSYNNLRPFGFCFAFILNGDWTEEEDQLGVMFVTDSRRSTLGFTIISSNELSSETGDNNFEKAAALLERAYTKMRESHAPSRKYLVSKQWLNIAERKTLLLRMQLDDNNFGDLFKVRIPAHYLTSAPGGQILNVKVNTTLGADREKDIAQELISGFVTTQNPECFLPVLEKMLRK